MPTTAATTPVKPTATTPSIASIKALREKDQWAEAEVAAKAYLQRYPHDVDGQFELATIQYHNQAYMAAEQTLQPALIAYPHYLNVRLLLINTEFALTKNQQALTLAESGLALSPNDPALLAAKAKAQALMQPPVVKKVAPIVAEPVAPKFVTYDDVSADYSAKRYNSARQKAQVYLSRYPNDGDMHYLLARIDAQLNLNDEAQQELLKTLQLNPQNTDARLQLIGIQLTAHNFSAAMDTVNMGLRYDPHNVVLLKKKADIQYASGDTVDSAQTLQQVLTLAPEDDSAQKLLTEIHNTPPEYGVGPYTAGTYNLINHASDVNQTWYYDRLYFGADTPYGYFEARGNYANRLDQEGTQAQLEFDPVINKYLYLQLQTGYSDELSLFPHYLFGAEAYVSLPKWIDLSLGDSYRNLGSTYLNSYTGSIAKTIGSYWFSFRPYHFIPSDNGPTSTLYTASIRRYFATPDSYIEISGGTGQSPDLTDLQTASFIKVDDDYVQAKLHFPVANHRFLVSVGPAYEKLVYPSGNVRELLGGSADVSVRFR